MPSDPVKPAPPQRPPSQYTEMVRQRGLAGVREARQQLRYGSAGVNAALTQGRTPIYAQPAKADSELYDRWQRQVTPAAKPETEYMLGRTEEGPYAGFKTQGLLQSATRGRAETIRRQDDEVFGALDQMAGDKLDRLEKEYSNQQEAVRSGIRRDDIVDADRQSIRSNMEYMSGRFANPVAGMQQRQKAFTTRVDDGRVDADPYVQDELNPWLETASTPLLEQQAFAAQVRRTPIAEYAQRAGAEYGVDPNIVGGWYTDASAVGDARDRRDLDMLDTTGMTWADTQSALNAMERDQTQMDNSVMSAEDQMLEDEIVQATGGLASGRELVSETGMTMTDVADVLATDAFAEYSAAIYDALATNDAGTVEDTVTSVMDTAAFQDPGLFNILQVLYKDYIPDTYDLYGG
jgi:hypothetical protein